ncbi:MAG: hypothetical protein KAG61_02890 [Bacteriovoracaceae bacterium]|nr:hypothetical protein [Bacteriovoracaceae bacterium]
MKIIIVFLLITSVAHAVTIDQCIQEGDNFGDGRGNDSVSDQCIELVLTDSNSVVSADGDILVTGQKNILITTNHITKTVKYISGKASLLNDISQVHFDLSRMRSLVYSKATRYLLSFNFNSYGNVAPIYRFKLRELEAEVSQVLQLPGVGLNAILFKNNEIRFYREKAMEHAHRPENNIKIKYKLLDKEGAFGTINSISYDKTKGLFILDSEKGKFSVELEKLPSVVIKSLL